MGATHITHQCPQCGAPVELQETDRIFACPFCRVRLFIHADGPLRHHLKPRFEHPGELVYAPYWRFRGNAFVLSPVDMRHKILDSSLLATSNRLLPPSLGLRTQAMELFFVEPHTPGRFMPASLDSETFKAQLLRSVPGLENRAGPRLTACIGDTLSLIYQPIYVADEALDAITGQRLGPVDIYTTGLETAGSHLHFLSTLCPQCGWDLQGDSQSLVQTCPHCDTAWKSGSQGATRITPAFLPSEQHPDIFLPFWNLRFRSSGFRLQTWADLIRLTNLPRAIVPWMESTAFTFRVPAFKIRPELFLNLSARVSLRQPESTAGETLPRTPLHPVTLPASEAFQALPVVLGHLTPARKNLFPKIQGGSFSPVEARLEYLPFVEGAEEYLQPDMNMAIQKKALFWSTTL